jgi:hypothetical protein
MGLELSESSLLKALRSRSQNSSTLLRASPGLQGNVDSHVIDRVKVTDTVVTIFGPISNRWLKSTIQLAKLGRGDLRIADFPKRAQRATGG